MGPDENVAIMQRAYDAFNTGDITTLNELFDESAVWHLPGRSSMADDYKGRDATLAYFGQLAERTGGTFRAELEHLTADGEGRVVGIHRSTANRDGKHLDVGDCIVFQLKDGRITDGHTSSREAQRIPNAGKQNCRDGSVARLSHPRGVLTCSGSPWCSAACPSPVTTRASS